MAAVRELLGVKKRVDRVRVIDGVEGHAVGLASDKGLGSGFSLSLQEASCCVYFILLLELQIALDTFLGRQVKERFIIVHGQYVFILSRLAALFTLFDPKYPAIGLD